jgi:hypothetical protein
MRKTALKLFATWVMLVSGDALAATHYVDLNGTNATPPYANWATAATNIQDAVDAAVAGDEIVVTDGIYHPLVVRKPLTLRSINGPHLTTIDGGGSGSCAYLLTNASLSGFTLTNGNSSAGGGVFCSSSMAVISNCVITGNRAVSSIPGYGGGANGGTLHNCLLNNNVANGGGGAANCTLNDCTLTGNLALVSGCSGAPGCTGFYGGAGGGAYQCALQNCTLVGNTASAPPLAPSTLCGGASGSRLNNCVIYFNTGGDCDSSCALNYCCTTPQPNTSVGNITNAPLFLDTNGWVDLHLQSNSPCINAGNNSYLTNSYLANSFDLDGNPRIAGGTVDIGAYEFQAPVSRISYAWLQHYGLPINAATDTADPDGDGVDNYHEWLANSDPTNPFSFPPLLTLIPYGPNVILTWPTNAFGFTLQSTTNLASPSLWATNSPAPVVIGGQNVVINPVSGPQQFYRLVH